MLIIGSRDAGSVETSVPMAVAFTHPCPESGYTPARFMSRTARKSFALTKSHAKRIWLRAQRLDEYAPFGDGPEATRAAVEHLGYVQIDTINVIERCHHHILYTRIPGYQRDHLRQAQTVDKTVFEYWTHALSYLPTRDMRFYIGAMKQRLAAPEHLVQRGEEGGPAQGAGPHQRSMAP